MKRCTHCGSVRLTLQDEVAELYKRRGYTTGPKTLLIGAMEELGEVAQAILLTECENFKPSRKKMQPEYDDARDVAREVGDCITYLLGLCNVLEIEPHFTWKEGSSRATELRPTCPGLPMKGHDGR